MEICITNMDYQNFNPFAAAPDELVANALDEAGLLTRDTIINSKPAWQLCQEFHRKRNLYKKTSRLGGILVSKAVISGEQLEIAIEHQKKQNCGRLGEALVGLKFCTRQDINEGLKVQTEIRNKDFPCKYNRIG